MDVSNIEEEFFSSCCCFYSVMSTPWRMCMCGCMDRKVDGCVDGAREERSVRVREGRDRQPDSETDIHGN